MNRLLPGVLLLSVLASGCDKPANTPKTEVVKKAEPTPTTTPTKDEHDHAEGPHGGLVIELGKYHGELVMDHDKKTATVYILDGKVKKAEFLDVPKLMLAIQSPQFVADLLPVPQDGDPAGKCSRFVATHDNFGKVQEFSGTVSGKIDGKPYVAEFKEEPHTHADKK